MIVQPADAIPCLPDVYLGNFVIILLAYEIVYALAVNTLDFLGFGKKWSWYDIACNGRQGAADGADAVRLAVIVDDFEFLASCHNYCPLYEGCFSYAGLLFQAMRAMRPEADCPEPDSAALSHQKYGRIVAKGGNFDFSPLQVKKQGLCLFPYALQLVLCQCQPSGFLASVWPWLVSGLSWAGTSSCAWLFI